MDMDLSLTIWIFGFYTSLNILIFDPNLQLFSKGEGTRNEKLDTCMKMKNFSFQVNYECRRRLLDSN